MNKRTKFQEFNHFSNLANEWWSETGKYKILHDIKPIRIKYILDNIKQKNLKKLKILDLGCGGGLVCEPLAKLGAKVTGIDFVQNNINVAKKHALDNNLKIDYFTKDIEKLKLNEKYDVILMFEILEHLDNWQNIIRKIKNLSTKNSKLIISTINRNFLSNLFAIKIAENIINWIPKKTHDYNKLIKPKELEKILIKENYNILDISGLIYNPIAREWRINKRNKLINYFLTAKLK